MNRKAQTEGLGSILLVFILVLVGVVLMTTSAQLIGDTVNTIGVANETLSSTNGTNLADLPQLQGKFVTDIVVLNGTNLFEITSGNFTIFNNQVINGVETALINVTASSQGGLQTQDWNISYTTQPTTFISNAGGRAIANIIIIFFAISIAFVALEPTLRNKFLDTVGK